ncbi:MAG: hypothetical protein ACOH18_04565 [Candidatus Saccharimonadaceae bacterium]
MARLPQPGQDSGTWGSILNDFLAVEHNTDGSLKASGSLSTKYSKPGSGIPAADLDAAVQVSLANADAAAAGTVIDATSAVKGALRLTGDLAGTADSPAISASAVTGAKIAAGTITDANISGTAAIAQSKVAGLTASLAGKSDISHTHVIANVTNLQSNLDSKAALVHTHAQSDVTGLTTALTGKANTVHSHATSDVTGLTQFITDTMGNTIIAGTNVAVSYDSGTGNTTISATPGSGGGSGSGAVDTVAGRSGDVILDAGDIASGTFSTLRIPNLDASKITTGTIGIARIPTGTGATQVSLGNHVHAQADVTGLTTALGTKANTSSLSTVATSGSYTDLSNKPTIPATAADVGAVSTTGLDAAAAAVVNNGSSATNTALDAKYATNTELSDAIASVTVTPAISDVIGLQSALDAKIPVGTHWMQVVVLPTSGSALPGDLNPDYPALIFVQAS